MTSRKTAPKGVGRPIEPDEPVAEPVAEPDAAVGETIHPELQAPQLLTRDRAERRSVKFMLPHTRDGSGYARVRRLPLMKLLTLSSASPTMQAVVTEVFGNAQANPDAPAEELVSGGALEMYRKNYALINGVCILGFQSPRLVETEEEADELDDPNVLWVEEIAQEDRQAYYDLVSAPESEAAKALEPFPAPRVENPRHYESVPPPPTPFPVAEAS